DGSARLAASLAGEAILAVARRYGRPLDAAIEADTIVGAVEIPTGDGGAATLSLVRHRSPVDVIANDWILVRAPGSGPVALPARPFAAAPRSLAAAIASR